MQTAVAYAGPTLQNTLLIKQNLSKKKLEPTKPGYAKEKKSSCSIISVMNIFINGKETNS